MCPDRQILSVYFDGELPSPWKEKMERHLASCPACRGIIENWKRISGDLRGGEEDSGAAGRVWEALCRRMEDLKGREEFPGGEGRRKSLWRRTVILPFPAAAAMAAAAAAVVLVLGSMAFRSSKGPVVPGPALSSLETAGIDMELNNIRPINDVSGVLQYLESTDSNDIVIIRLPESRSFQSAGEPKMLRAADYSPRRSGQ
jgi:anti-sigma factor RsiW